MRPVLRRCDIRNLKMEEIRKKKKLSAKEAADRLGVSVSYYYKIEEGTRNPSYNFIKKFKEHFNVKVDSIFFQKKMKKNN